MCRDLGGLQGEVRGLRCDPQAPLGARCLQARGPPGAERESPASLPRMDSQTRTLEPELLANGRSLQGWEERVVLPFTCHLCPSSGLPVTPGPCPQPCDGPSCVEALAVLSGGNGA